MNKQRIKVYLENLMMSMVRLSVWVGIYARQTEGFSRSTPLTDISYCKINRSAGAVGRALPYTHARATVQMRISDDTVLRERRRAGPMPCRLHLWPGGIDDCALARGYRHSTIVVGLRRPCPIAMLPQAQRHYSRAMAADAACCRSGRLGQRDGDRDGASA